jgi:S-adenosylmethionine hydrolase
MIAALLTDFGVVDPYAGVMKASIASIAPSATLIDLSHGIPPGAVEVAALFLRASVEYFPAGTVFVCVVDPGVGSARRAIAAQKANRLFVAPDNGLLPAALGTVDRAFEIAPRYVRPNRVGETFHGRDVFGPAASHLLRGVPIEALGPQASALHTLPQPSGHRIVWVDHFGNLIIDIEPAALGSNFELSCGTFSTSRVCASYSDVEPGELALVANSYGLVEIACRDGSAATALGLSRGTPVTLK